MTLNDIIALNNRAISFLQQGKREMDDKAIAYLHEALCRLRKRSNMTTKLTTSTSTKKQSASNHRPIKRRIRPSSNISAATEQQQQQESITICKVPIPANNEQQRKQQQQPDSENLFSLYRYGFFMAPKTTGSTVSSKKTNNQVYIVLLYNIGLALHLEGIDNNSKKSNLKKALQFYEMAMSLIDIAWKDVDPDDFLLLLAVSNNLGHIHSHFLNFTETKKFLVWLRHLMKAYQQCSTRGNIVAEKDYSFFFTNSLFLEDIQELSCAPTA